MKNQWMADLKKGEETRNRLLELEKEREKLIAQ